MNRRQSIGNILQALVLFWACSHLWDRWAPLSIGVGIGGILQLVGAMSLLYWRRPRWALWASVLTLGVAAMGLGLYAHAALHLMERFGEQAVTTGESALNVLLLGLPWAIGFPLWQVFSLRKAERLGSSRTRMDGRWMGLILLGALVMPSAFGAWSDQPVQTWDVQPDLQNAAQGAWLRWTNEDPEAPIPKGDGPVQLLLTPWVEGEAGQTVRGEGEDLESAVVHALSQLEPWPAGRTGLVMDLAREQLSGGAMAVGETGALSDTGGLSPSVAWRPGGTSRHPIFYRWSVPSIHPRLLGNASRVRFDSVLVDDSGPRELQAGWTRPDPLTATGLRESALEGARMLARNQDETGRFTYLVKGPSGTAGPGYNLPRHAGTTWFLARIAQQTDDPEISRAARSGLEWMVERTTMFETGRGAFYDSSRKDGRIWVGTTALAVLAAVELEHDIAPIWGRFIDASVDEHGQVRGEADQSGGSFSEQAHNPYGQGQTLLALAALVRAGHSEFREALVRGAAYLEGDYAPLGAGKLVTIDEHWACLAAVAIQDVLDHAAGRSICEAYLRDESTSPSPTQGLRIHVASAGGVAEAVVALAVLDPDGPWRQAAMGYGELFLEAQYRPEDAPFLKNPKALEGGYRSTPFVLDVQIDTVQHVGSAMLGIAALIDGDWKAGSLP